MDNKKFAQLKKKVQGLQSLARYLVQATDNLNDILENLNPSNPVKKRKSPTLEELTQIELQQIINKPKR